MFALPNSAYLLALPEETADRKALLNDVTRYVCSLIIVINMLECARK